MFVSTLLSIIQLFFILFFICLTIYHHLSILFTARTAVSTRDIDPSSSLLQHLAEIKEEIIKNNNPPVTATTTGTTAAVEIIRALNALGYGDNTGGNMKKKMRNKIKNDNGESVSSMYCTVLTILIIFIISIISIISIILINLIILIILIMLIIYINPIFIEIIISHR